MTWPKPPRRSKSGRPCSQPDKAARACAVTSGPALGLGARAPKRGAKAALPRLRRGAKPHHTCDGHAKPAVGGDGALAFFRERKSKAHRSRPDRRSTHQAEPKTEANSAGIKKPSAQVSLGPSLCLQEQETPFISVYSSGSLPVSHGFSASAQARAGQVLEALERNAWRLKEGQAARALNWLQCPPGWACVMTAL